MKKKKKNKNKNKNRERNEIMGLNVSAFVAFHLHVRLVKEIIGLRSML